MESLGDILKRVTLRHTYGAGAEGEVEAEESSCTRCAGKGWVRTEVPIGHPDFGKAQPCSCQQQATQVEHLERLQRYSNLGYLVRLTFDTLDPRGRSSAPEPQRRFAAALKAARLYAEDPKGWFVLTGGSGSGKTHLAAAMANRCLERSQPAFFMTIPDLLDHLRSTYAPTSDIPYDELFDQVRNAPLLVLDDLGVHSSTPWAQEKLFQVLNHRYATRLPTVVTLSRPLEDVDERLRSRLTDAQLSQVHELATPLEPVLQQVGMLEEKMLARMTFEGFDVRGSRDTDAHGRTTLEQAFTFARAFAEDPLGWVVFTGVPGCGKTHLAVAIAGRRLTQGHPIFFAFVPALLDHLRYTFSPESRVTYDDLFERVKTTPLLILDDLGAELGTPWAQEKMYQIIVYRHNAQLPTIITTTIDDVDKFHPPIASRLKEQPLVTFMPIGAGDYRDQARAPTRGVPRSRSRGRDRYP